MVGLGRHVVGQGLHLGDDGSTEGVRGSHFPNEVVGYSLVLGAGVVNPAAVLRAAVGALPVQGSRIVDDEKDFQDMSNYLLEVAEIEKKAFKELEKIKW